MSPAIESKIVRDEDKGTATLVVVIPGQPILEATSGHPNWDDLVAEASKVAPDAQKLADLNDVSAAAARKFDRLSERVTVAYGRVFFDGTEVDNALSKQISRFVKEKRDFGPLVKFYEKIATNPSLNSQKQLFIWLAANDFAIFPDGDFLAFKGVNNAGGKYLSSRSGKAIVDDVVIEGQIPYAPGTVVSMPRDEVRDDPRQNCHIGLHMATYGFARGFADGTVMEVKVNPRDVVSVPDYGDKMRVCRAEVVALAKGDRKEALLSLKPPVEAKPEVPVPTQPELDVTGQGTPVVKRQKPLREGVITDELRSKYADKKFWQNRKTGSYWIQTSKNLGVIRLLAADGSGERKTQTEKSIKKSFRLRDG